ncbi:hypothetical protein I5R92_11340 [Pseudomonas carnis]|uniref:phage baseplate protein n=1 Tax=Pseudomonas carnis TaxID=2487355 RepID=UPI0018D835F3|nr:hypothetical protein [Pseudomonas carnis]MBH3367879.1 hypothetical protein [Pseudomonas carnis]
MTIAIRRKNGDILWFDAIEGFDEVLTATTTKHPIGSGAFVTDHIIKDNPRFTLRGILSDADFNYNRPQMSDYNSSLATAGLQQADAYFPAPDKQYVNNTPTNSPVSINSNTNTFKKYLPDSIAQYKTTEIPEVVVTEQPKVKAAAAVRMDLVTIMQEKEEFTVVDFDASLIKRSWEHCVLTGLSFSENADGGDAQALFPVMQIEQVRYAETKQIKVRIKNKGRKQGIATKRSKVSDDAPNSAPTDLSHQSASQRVNAQGPKSGALTAPKEPQRTGNEGVNP